MHQGDSQQSAQKTSENCEEPAVSNEVFRNTLADNTYTDGQDQMLHDVEPGFLSPKNLRWLEQMRKDAKTPLYRTCKVSKLEANLRLLDAKGLSDKGFEDLLHVVKNLLPIPNEIAETTYQAKLMICPLGLEVEKIHACPKDCILHRGQYENLDKCFVNLRGTSRRS